MRSFPNADFLKAFSQAFLAFAISLDPNNKFDPTNITPQWNKFSVNNTEMLFNRTEDSSAPVIHTFTTDQNLLERCKYVKLYYRGVTSFNYYLKVSGKALVNSQNSDRVASIVQCLSVTTVGLYEVIKYNGTEQQAMS